MCALVAHYATRMKDTMTQVAVWDKTNVVDNDITKEIRLLGNPVGCTNGSRNNN